MYQISGRNSAFLLAVVSIALLSSNATVAILAGAGVSPLVFSLACSVVTASVLIARGGRADLALWRDLFAQKWFWVAIVLKVINDLAFYYAIISSRQIEATVIVYLYPVFNALLGGVLLGAAYQRLTWKEWLLFAMSFVSIVLLTPLSNLAQLSPTIFAVALVSAVASVYVVLIQVVTDRAGLEHSQERGVLCWLFIASAIVQGGALLLMHQMRPDLALWGGLSAETVWPVILGVLWIGVMVNWLSEAFWLRAARLYTAISLKSLFYLSPVLGAFYLAALGVDTLDEVTVFCLAGVVVSNVLLHQRQIDDLSFVVFLFALISGAVLLRLAPEESMLQSFRLSPDMFQTQITFISVIGGFILLRAFEIYQRAADAFQDLLTAVAQSHPSIVRDPDLAQAAFDRLGAQPDMAQWTDDATSHWASPVLLSSEVRDPYLRYLRMRLMGLSRPERMLMYLVCLLAVPSILSQASAAGSGAFVSAFAVGVFCFLPILVDEQVTFRIARPVTGILVRRTLLAQLGPDVEEVDPAIQPRFVHLRNERTRTAIFLALTAVVCSAAWLLLET
ncbi:MAG: DMT family transporter [Pseudomonadota bacterium]